MTIWQKAGLVLSSQSLTPVNARGTALVAIAPDIQDPELLLSGVETGVPAIILDNNHNAVEQITEALTQSSASSLHIVCHGAPGTLKLGKTTLTSANIGQYTHLLQEWGVTNILLWACEVAQNPEFLTTLHQLTGANIAASTQVIGNSATYRNWQLESQIGDMVTEPSVFTPATLQNYSGLFVDPGSNFLTAQNIGVLGATQNFSEVVGTTDRNDYYKFTLNQISAVNLNLTGLEEPAQLQIVTDLNGDGILGSGEDIEYDNISDFSSSIADRSISGKVLSPGTYAIRVYTYDSDQNTSYDLSASATALPPTNPTDPGSSFQAARNIGTLGALQTFTDAVGTLDRRDSYKFTLNEISQVSLNLTGLTEPAQLAIATDFDNDGIVDSNEFIEYDNISDFPVQSMTEASPEFSSLELTQSVFILTTLTRIPATH
ncbi:MAG: DUF4347 domain-containing protein [Oscillatoriales cyanobacterium SM2_3_0]|nr:DUF4347 domain-containing protein [Oscillatoriales cyanobacterium SM2_3_0]